MDPAVIADAAGQLGFAVADELRDPHQAVLALAKKMLEIKAALQQPPNQPPAQPPMAPIDPLSPQGIVMFLTSLADAEKLWRILNNFDDHTTLAINIGVVAATIVAFLLFLRGLSQSSKRKQATPRLTPRKKKLDMQQLRELRREVRAPLRSEVDLDDQRQDPSPITFSPGGSKKKNAQNGAPHQRLVEEP